MWRKVEWVFRILYNLIRLPLLCFLYFGKVNFTIIEMLAPNVKIRVDNGGVIYLGKKCMFDSGTLIRSSGGKINIGNGVYINRNCNVVSKESIIIGNEVTIGPNVCIYDHDHTFGENTTSDFKVTPIVIGDNVWIGANAVILRGATIGSNCVIGAGTVVKGSIPMKKLVIQEKGLKVIDID